MYSEGTVPILGYEAERQWMQRDARANTWVTVHTPYSWGMSQGQVSSDFMVDRDGDVIMADGPSLNASVYVEDEALSPSI